VAVYLDVYVDVTPNTFRGPSYQLYWWTAGRWLTLMGVLGVLLLIVASWQRSGMAIVWLGSFMAAFGLLGGPGFGAYRLFYPHKGALQTGRFHFVGTDEGIHVEGDVGTQQLKWTAYIGAYIDRDFAYLLITRSQAQCIPISHAGNLEPLMDHLRAIGLLRPLPRNFFLV